MFAVAPSTLSNFQVAEAVSVMVIAICLLLQTFRRP